MKQTQNSLFALRKKVEASKKWFIDWATTTQSRLFVARNWSEQISKSKPFFLPKIVQKLYIS